MRRLHGHLAFGVVAAALAVVTTVEVLRLERAQTVNAAIAGWMSDASPALYDRGTMKTRRTAGPSNAERAEKAPTTTGPRATRTVRSATAEPNTSPVPEARLGHAVALAKVDYDGALAAYKAIIQGGREDLRRIALYDLGNLHLREALQVGLEDEAQSLPLLELAKQSYRDLLRRDPNDWDARYNLERTLRLAPEDDDDTDEDTGPPDPREHERSTIADPRMDLP